MTTKVQAKDIENKAFLTTGTAPNYEIVIPRETSYADMDRMEILVNFHSAGTGAITLNINGLGAKATGLTDVDVDSYYIMIYDLSKDSFDTISGGGVGGSSQSVFISTPQNIADATVYTITHNLGITQADAEASRYKVMFSFKNDGSSNGYYNELCATSDSVNHNERSASDPTQTSEIMFQENTLKFKSNTSASTFSECRIHIIDTWVTGIGYDVVTNNAGYSIFDSTMNGTTPVVINDSRITDKTPFNVYYESEPAGNITKTLANGSISLVSDDVTDTMNFRLVAFNMGTDTYITSEVQTLNGAGPRVIVDGNITVGTPVNLFPIDTPAGYLTVEAEAGQITITSTTTETNLNIRYIAFTELSTGSILDGAYGPTRDGDTSNAPSRNAVYDKINSLVTGAQIITAVSGDDMIIAEANTTRTTPSSTLWYKLKEIQINAIQANGNNISTPYTLKTNFEAYRVGSGSGDCLAGIYKNGVLVSSVVLSLSYEPFTIDVSGVEIGDTIELRGRPIDGNEARVKNFNVKFSEQMITDYAGTVITD